MLRLLELGLGARLLLIILLTAVVPLALAGAWLTRDAGEAGERLLEQRMEESLAAIAREVGAQWLRSRSALLDLAESEEVLALMPDEASPPAGELESGMPLSVSGRLGERLQEIGHGIVIRDRAGTAVARFLPRDPASARGLPVRLPLHAPLSGEHLGSVETRLIPESLVPRAPEWTARTGGVLGILEPDGGTSVLPTPFDPRLMAQPRFSLGGEEWITVRRALADPPAVLVLASPLEPFTEPFRQAARRGILLLVAVALTGFGVAALLTRQAVRSVGELEEASAAVARGELGRRVAVQGPREVRHLARAFNEMAGELERTLEALAKREALAAVGEFASALAHELRNPLTAIRVDLQRIDEVSDDEEGHRLLTDRMLASVRRLDQTVSGVLRVAGSGRIRLEPLDVADFLVPALEAAEPAIEKAGAELRDLASAHPLSRVQGDGAALERLFLNLLLNAAEAVEEAQRRVVEVDADEVADQGTVEIHVRDTGRGIPPDELERIFEPLYSTKTGGTGLGLAISERIARAHGGDIQVESRSGGGTTVTVQLPAEDDANARRSESE